jgi:hypothetical protein
MADQTCNPKKLMPHFEKVIQIITDLPAFSKHGGQDVVKKRKRQLPGRFSSTFPKSLMKKEVSHS